MREHGSRRRRWWWLAAGAGVVVVAGVVAAVAVGNDSTELTVSEAVDDYEADDLRGGTGGGGRDGGAAALPAPGVYVYATTGRAEVDALTGAAHDYPDRTTITVSRQGCGANLRWVGVEERWEERVVCPSDGALVLDRIRAYRQFFQQGDERVYTCDGLVEVPAAPVTTLRGSCASEGTGKSGATTIRFRGTVRDHEPVTVAGERHDAVHVRITGRFTGTTEGVQTTERWLLPSGLVAREERTQRTVSDSVVGRVTFEERYAIRLVSTEPHR
ncbi:MAG TPA: hypothetical protein VFW63_07350 [Acidimicrobiales bacterium]|nr:hypothetical protein [Acidimicrobiales bacterium]